MSHSSVRVLDITAQDAEGDSIDYDVAAILHNPCLELEQQFAFVQRDGSYYLNALGAAEKWIYSSAADRWFFLLPDGGLHDWDLSATASGSLVAALDAGVYEEPALLHEASVPAGAVPVALDVAIAAGRATLTIDPADDFVGSFQISITASDGQAAAHRSFLVTVINDLPEFETIHGDQTLRHRDALRLEITAADADDAVTYSAEARAYDLLYELDQRLDLSQSGGTYHTGWMGRREKWLWSNTERTWYYLLPGGELWRWNDGLAAASDRPAAGVGEDAYLDPNLLHQAQQPPAGLPATVAIDSDAAGTWLTIEPDLAYAGIVQVTVTASDGLSATRQRFLITVGNNAPQFPAAAGSFQAIADQQVAPGKSLTIALSATDADSDALVYSAEVNARGSIVRDSRNPIFTAQPGFGDWMYGPSAVQVGDKILVALKNETPRGIMLWEAANGVDFQFQGVIIAPTPGSYDQAGAAAPLLIHDEATGLLHLYYNADRGGEHMQIAYATAHASDPSQWTRQGLVLSEQSVAEYFGWSAVGDLAVWDMVEIDGVKTWYGHASPAAAQGVYYLWRAESTGWTDLRIVESYAVMGADGGLFSPSVIQLPGQSGYRQVYSHSQQNGLWPYPWDLRWASSADGRSWQEQGLLLSPSVSGWDSQTVYAARILKEPRAPFAAPILDDHGQAMLFYSGRGSGQDIAGIAYWNVTPPAQVSISGATLTVKVAPQATGSFQLTVTAQDAAGATARTSFNVTVTSNAAPQMTSFPDLQLLPGESRSVSLSATDSNGDALAFQADVVGDDLDSLASRLDRQLGLFSDGQFLENWGGLREKWLRGAGQLWYFLTTTGDLYRWDGGQNLKRSQWIATLSADYYVNPAKLFDALSMAAAPVSVVASGNLLYVSAGPAAGSLVQVRVTATDWTGASAVRFFTVRVVSAYTDIPTLAPISNQNLAAGQNVKLALSASDPDGDTVTLHARLVGDFADEHDLARQAYALDRQLELFAAGNYWENWGGRGEKWLQGAGGTWYFITGEGRLYLHDGQSNLSSSTLIARLGPAYFADPRLLHEALAPRRQPAPPAAVSVAGSVLTLAIAADARGSFTVQVIASDDQGARRQRSFTVTIS